MDLCRKGGEEVFQDIAWVRILGMSIHLHARNHATYVEAAGEELGARMNAIRALYSPEPW
jgi:hypothetical protein